MELRHLRYFLSVAETLNFTRAAEHLHIAQPGLSRQVRDLEEMVGTPLFTRTKHSVTLTPAGVAFREQAALILEQAQRAAHIARRVAGGEIGRLSIGFVGSAGYSFLPWTLRTFHQRFPDVELELREMDAPRQIVALRDGSIDVGFLRLPVNDADIAFETIFREPFVIALPADHPLAVLAVISMRQLTDEPFVMFPDRAGSGFRAQISEACQQFGFLPRIAQEASPMQNVIGLVEAGLGLSIVPVSVTKIQTPEVAYRPIKETLPPASIALAWNKADKSAVLSGFAEIAREVARERSSYERLAAEHSESAVDRKSG